MYDDIKIPGYNRLAAHRFQINLASGIFLIIRDFPIGVGISYSKILSHTVNRIVQSSIPTHEITPNCLSEFRMDLMALVGIASISRSHPDMSTKNFILFGFKLLSISNNYGTEVWKNHVPNSPFSIRPITLIAQQENEENVKYLMNTVINDETDRIKRWFRID